MNERTREILDAEMVRDWTMVWAGCSGYPTPVDGSVRGTAREAVAEFEARHGLTLQSHRLVMDDGDWTIRATFADGSVATIFAG